MRNTSTCKLDDNLREILLDVRNFDIETWFERDRAHVELMLNPDLNIDLATIPELPEWWDEAVQEAIDDGFLDPRNYLKSAHAYYMEHVTSM